MFERLGNGYVALKPARHRGGDDLGKRMVYYRGQLAATMQGEYLSPVADLTTCRIINRSLNGRFRWNVNCKGRSVSAERNGSAPNDLFGIEIEVEGFDPLRRGPEASRRYWNIKEDGSLRNNGESSCLSCCLQTRCLMRYTTCTAGCAQAEPSIRTASTFTPTC